MTTFKRVAVYCASSDSVPEVYFEAARGLGRLLAARGIGVVFGGGVVGLMGACADATMEAGGEVIGVIPEKLMALEVGHHGVTRLEVVADMRKRKQRMEELSDAFIAMPGGFGTLDEIFEAACNTQLHYHLKPCGILNTDGYYDGVVQWLERAVRETFVRDAHRHIVVSADDPETLLTRMVEADLTGIPKWLER
jgi:hypothetical protein